MMKGSCLCVFVSVCLSTHITETAVLDRLIRDEFISWAPGEDVPDLSVFSPTKQAADASSDTIPPAMVSDLRVASYDVKTQIVTLTWTAPGDDGHTGTAKRFDIRMAESRTQIQTNFSASPKVERDMLLAGQLTTKAAGTPQQIMFEIPNKAIWKEYVFALKTFDEVNNESPVSVTIPLPYSSYVTHMTAAATAVAAAAVTKAVSTPRGHSTTQSHQSHMSPPAKRPDVGVIVGGSLCGVAGAAATTGIVIKVLYKKKTKLQPHPLEAKMTEPSVPRENFAIINSTK
ncbi:uncharacterized protein LOC124285928 [Haliotis rubra]|uniref:uncharacterized protein LOC124285928 n=1 Tax=Haliotis rubra TaxID=36100 RepID=UPI001EE509B1|nr:uncharacterized protein LOC124285928 [Haliotis rubra]XP_046578160.1 uncharacterized protein LOC124285928 [Haliotis rubra]